MGEYGSIRYCFNSERNLPLERYTYLHGGSFWLEAKERSKQYLNLIAKRCKWNSWLNYRVTRAERWSRNDCMWEPTWVYSPLRWNFRRNSYWFSLHCFKDPQTNERHMGVFYRHAPLATTLCEFAQQARIKRDVSASNYKNRSTFAYVWRPQWLDNIWWRLAVQY